MTPAEAIDARLVEFRAVLEACAAEGFDPSSVFLNSSGAGHAWIWPNGGGRHVSEAKARAVLARLTDGDPVRSDVSASSSYALGDIRVFAERHPDAPPVQSEASSGAIL